MDEGGRRNSIGQRGRHPDGGGLLEPPASQAGQEPLVIHDVLDSLVRAYEIQGTLGMLNDFRKFGID